MSKHKLIVFGTAEMAEMASFYFSNDSSHEVVGFTVDDEYVSESMFQNKPVIPFSEIKKKFDPKIYKMHVALSYKNMNKIHRGYFTMLAINQCNNFIHKTDVTDGIYKRSRISLYIKLT